ATRAIQPLHALRPALPVLSPVAWLATAGAATRCAAFACEPWKSRVRLRAKLPPAAVPAAQPQLHTPKASTHSMTLTLPALRGSAANSSGPSAKAAVMATLSLGLVLLVVSNGVPHCRV